MELKDYGLPTTSISPDVFIERKIDTEEDVPIVTIGDIHAGSEHFNERFFKKAINWAVDNGAYVMMLGDYFENGLLHFGKQDQKSADDIMDFLVDSLMPLKDRILAAVTGNHDDRSLKHQPQIDITRVLCTRLGIQHLYRPNGALVKVKLGKDSRHSRPLTYWLYGTHGIGGARGEGGKMMQLKRMSQNYTFCDLYLMGHYHWIMSNSDSVWVPVENSIDNRVVKHVRKYLLCGSFLDWGGYAERGQFQMGNMSIPYVTLDAKIKDVRITI
jgi:hypothetical protein